MAAPQWLTDLLAEHQADSPRFCSCGEHIPGWWADHAADVVAERMAQEIHLLASRATGGDDETARGYLSGVAAAVKVVQGDACDRGVAGSAVGA